MRKRVLIEFVKDTVNSEGEQVRAKGDRLLVDQQSARSFVKKKVAKLVVEKGEAAPDLGEDDAQAEQAEAPAAGGD